MIKVFMITGMVIISAAGAWAAPTSDIEVALMNKDYELSRKLAEKLLKSTAVHKDRLQAQYYLGLSQLRLEKYAQARSSFQIVMSMAASKDLYDRAAVGMIEALHKPGLYKEALKTVEALLQKSPQSSFLSLIYLKKARIHLKLGEWGMAKEDLLKIINEFPDSLEAPIARNLMEEKEFFSVQVGSFLDKDKAISLMEELKANGQYAYIIETSTADQNKYYRVRVGQTASLSDARTLEAKLAQLGYPTLIYP